MVFNTLWTILLGILGGIISSIIVSRVFLIQTNYQNQLRIVEQSIRRLGLLSGYINAVKSVFEVSYDEDVQMHKEMNEKGYKCEIEYYAAHQDKDWISKNALLNTFLIEVKKTAEPLKNDLISMTLDDSLLKKINRDMLKYATELASIKEFTFSQINALEKLWFTITGDFESCKTISTKLLLKKVLIDKTMIVLFVLLTTLIIVTAAAYWIGL